jgi:hypothetical protein
MIKPAAGPPVTDREGLEESITVGEPAIVDGNRRALLAIDQTA